MVTVSNADRIVFPELGRTKGDVVAYYAHIAARALPHVTARPLSIRRYPKGIGAAGFFQKNVPPHYPASIARFPVPRQPEPGKKKKKSGDDVTVYPLVSTGEHLAYLGNQGAIELHVTTARAPDLAHPDRLVIDLDPPPGALEQVRRAAVLAREALGAHGLASVPVATGSKGYHVIAPIAPTVEVEALAHAVRQLATLLSAQHPGELTTVFRVAQRGGAVFVDWLRNNPSASVIAPYSLRASPRARVATPIGWDELTRIAPDAFGIDDLDALLERPDPLAALAQTPGDATAFVRDVGEAFAASGLVLETFDRFRS